MDLSERWSFATRSCRPRHVHVALRLPAHEGMPKLGRWVYACRCDASLARPNLAGGQLESKLGQAIDVAKQQAHSSHVVKCGEHGECGECGKYGECEAEACPRLSQCGSQAAPQSACRPSPLPAARPLRATPLAVRGPRASASCPPSRATCARCPTRASARTPRARRGPQRRATGGTQTHPLLKHIRARRPRHTRHAPPALSPEEARASRASELPTSATSCDFIKNKRRILAILR